VIIMAASLPTSADVRKAREQAAKAVNTRFDLVRTPLLAGLGVGDLAVHKVNDAVAKARVRATERREAARQRAEKLQGQLGELPTELRGRFDSELRDKLTGDELRKRVDEVTERARKTYSDLAGRGEETLERIRREPRVARFITVVEDASERFDKRVDRVVDDVHDAGEEVLGRVSRQTRSVGERTARSTEEAGSDVAEAIQQAGDDAAHATRSTTRKAANRTAPRKQSTSRRATNGSRTTK
jgi:heparin binding hemagglutinin HbhA